MTSQRRWQVMARARARTLGVVALGAALTLAGCGGQDRPATPVAAATAARSQSNLATWAEGIERGDSAALKALTGRLTPPSDRPVLAAVPVEEAGDYLRVLAALRGGFRAFPPADRTQGIADASLILARFAVEPAPPVALDALKPTYDLFQAGLADPSVDVRSATLNVLGGHWSWMPGRAMTPAEEATLAEWKDSFVKPATRCLGDREAKSRAAAVVCLGSAPIDAIAAPAAAYVEDKENGQVRYKALMTFANRPTLLSEDTVLKRLHDPEPGIAELAELILKGRGLSKDQIYLGRQMDDPHPEIRAAVIPLIADRTDIDPVVWLIRLSHDTDPTVRNQAALALAKRGESVEADHRLREMAQSDASATVRESAAKLVAQLVRDATASLPSLPATSTTATGMTIRAN